MAKYDSKLQEELKLHVAEEFFAAYDCKRKIGKNGLCPERTHRVVEPALGGGDVDAEVEPGTYKAFLLAYASWPV